MLTSLPFVMLNGRVLLELNDQGDKTLSGRLYVPETAKDAPQTGTVVATCPKWRDGSEWIEPLCEVGDKVVFGKYDGTEIEHEGKKYISIKESALHAIVETGQQEIGQLSEQSE